MKPFENIWNQSTWNKTFEIPFYKLGNQKFLLHSKNTTFMKIYILGINETNSTALNMPTGAKVDFNNEQRLWDSTLH